MRVRLAETDGEDAVYVSEAAQMTPVTPRSAPARSRLRALRDASEPPGASPTGAKSGLDRASGDGSEPSIRGVAMSRHLLSAGDLDHAAAVRILDDAEQLDRALAGREVKKLPTLRGRTVVNLFYEDSTRTRTSFELAAKRLSADVVNFSAKGSSVSKGESLKDTALTLEAMGADAVVIRHSYSGAANRLATWVRGSVVNAGDGTHEHPTQALLDAFTIRRRLRVGTGDLAGLHVVIVGDVLHSRVARSNALLLTTLGAHVRVRRAADAAAGGHRGDGPVEFGYDLDAALPDADVVMMLRVQRERMGAGFFPSAREYSRRYGLDRRRMAALPEHAIVMHPGPMNRGMEIAAEVADDPKRSTIVEQVTNGVSVRMAVLYGLLSGDSDATGGDRRERSRADQRPSLRRGRGRRR